MTMIKTGEELLRLQEENQKLGAKVYALSSQIVSLEQDKIDLANEIKGLKEGIAKAEEEMDKLASHKVRPISFDQSVAIDMCIEIIDKLIKKE